MKLIRLLLQAFGPFTDAEIDFTGDGNDSGANLHLIYGPNEAGKSSALRAMTDLRFGIPLRSPDDFLHTSTDLRIAGVFVGAEGKPVGLVRRKGRKATLSLFDTTTGDPASVVEAGREHELALTGGLEREEFEAMFGLNHARLRAGGDRLLKGEGELGSALFEASAGTRGIAAILASLDEDAKKFFSPRGRNAVINEARRALDDHRKAWKEAQTRPAEWQELNRAHQHAQEALAQIDRDLEAARRRENELTELRTVAPLLRVHDLAVTELQGLADAPDLPEKARESRLAAEQALQRAKADVHDAERELNHCAETLDSLLIEAPLLAHAEAIERLANSVEAMARSRIEAQQHQAAIDQIGEELAATVARCAPGKKVEDVLGAMPSEADRATLNEHLSEITRLKDRVEDYRSRADALDDLDGLEAQDAVQLPDAETRQALVTALRHAQGLGNTSQQSADLERNIRELADKSAQALADLDIDSADVLRRSRPLLESQIGSARKAVADIDEAIRKLRDEAERLGADQEQQQRQKRQLAAAGEIVTAETLRLARARRDEGWVLIRKAYVERSHDPAELGKTFDAEHLLPEAFEAVQEAADHQADKLRVDATRAALYEECAERIAQMGCRQREIAEKLAGLGERRQAALDDWFRQLADARLPRLEPDALREWQAAREAALELALRLEREQAERDRLVGREAEAVGMLAAALQAIGHATHGLDLPSLIEQASRWERQATELGAKREERAKARQERRIEREKLDGQLAAIEAELQSHIAAVEAWHVRLFLGAGSASATFKAQLDELDRLARREAELRVQRQRQAHHQAVVNDFEKQAAQLAQLLGEPAPKAADDFAGQLQARLKASRSQEQQRLNLIRDQKRAEATKRDAETELAKQSMVLDQLCAAAGVETATELPECEERSARKRQLQAALAGQRQQLAQASARPEAELRERLADQDAIAVDAERERCRTEITRLEQEQTGARREEEQTRRALEAIDASDAAAKAREAMESAVARYQAAIRPWARLRLGHALLRDSLKRFRERAQAPMIAAASAFFSLMTDGRYCRLVADETDDKPILLAERVDGICIGVEAMSEGTADQLYLSLRLAALQLRRDSHPQMPLVLDDVLITSDDMRAANILRALARFAEGGQVMLFTHHRHLIELARHILTEQDLAVHDLSATEKMTA
jgi:uncharacterized protein YhaN